MAEVFAGFLSHRRRSDGSWTRVGRLDNTIIVVISDNGTSAARADHNGSVSRRQKGFFSSYIDTVAGMSSSTTSVARRPQPSIGWAMTLTPTKLFQALRLA